MKNIKFNCSAIDMKALRKSKARSQGALDAGNPAMSLQIFSLNVTAESLRNFAAKVAK